MLVVSFMSDKKSGILVLVEGAKTDVRLMRHLFKIFGIDDRHEIVAYNTNIYALYNSIFSEQDPSNLDILLHLKARESDPDIKALLDKRYSEILLIFDLEPQDPQFAEDKIRKMLDFFSESTDMGKLYINYPMVEAFYHMKSIPDADYNNYTTSMNELKSGQYKARVNKENRNGNYTKFAIDKKETSTVIWQNIIKAWRIINTDTSQENTPPNPTAILEAQLSKVKDEQIISVLCTCVFYIVDYNAVLINEYISDISVIKG